MNSQLIPIKTLNKYIAYNVICYYPWHDDIPVWTIELISGKWWYPNKRIVCKGQRLSANSDQYVPPKYFGLIHQQCIKHFGYTQTLRYV